MKKLMIVAFAVSASLAACGGKKTESTTTNVEAPAAEGSATGTDTGSADPAAPADGTTDPAAGSAEAPAGGM